MEAWAAWTEAKAVNDPGNRTRVCSPLHLFSANIVKTQIVIVKSLNYPPALSILDVQLYVVKLLSHC